MHYRANGEPFLCMASSNDVGDAARRARNYKLALRFMTACSVPTSPPIYILLAGQLALGCGLTAPDALYQVGGTV
jgi:hypothetical protein